MNREILFRGKRKDAPHQWIAGDLNHIDGNVYIFDRDPNSDLNSPDWYEVNPETVGQFTGLLDKEGNKIFEGDIIRTMSGIAVVVWLDAAFALESPGSEAVDWVYSSVFKQSEILGNIHETPELINQQQ